MLFYCSSFDSFSLTLCTFKHRKGICTYLSSYLPRLHNKLDYVRLSRNLYIDYVHFSRNLHIQYVRLGRNLYVHYVRLRPTLFLTSPNIAGPTIVGGVSCSVDSSGEVTIVFTIGLKNIIIIWAMFSMSGMRFSHKQTQVLNVTCLRYMD